MRNRKRLVSILAGIMAAVMLLSLIAMLLPTPASASVSSEIRAQINDLRAQRNEIKNQIKEIKEEYKENEDEVADIIARKNVIDQEVALLHAEIMNISEQISAFNVLIADKQDELDHAEENYLTLNEENKSRIRTMEEEGSLSYWEVLFKANSFSDLLDRLNMVEEIAASDQRRLKALSDAKDAVEVAQAELEEEKAALEETKTELDTAQEELAVKREEADAVFQELMEKAEELKAMQEELEEAENTMLNEIAQLEAEYTKAKYQEYLDYMATYTTEAPPVSSGGTGEGGNNGNNGNNGNTSGGNTQPNVNVGSGWIVPCSYVMLTSPFGNRNTGIAGASTYHQGVDLAAPSGTPIYASRGGTVTRATYGAASGNYVSINHHDGFSSIYMHMTHYVVSAGQQVAQGQVIGYVGRSGIASGDHLHFGISYNGVYVNPCAYVALG